MLWKPLSFLIHETWLMWTIEVGVECPNPNDWFCRLMAQHTSEALIQLSGILPDPMRQGVFANSWLKTIWDLIYRAITAMISNYYWLSIYHPLADDLGRTLLKLSPSVLVHFTNTLAYFQRSRCSFVSIAWVCQVCSFKWDTATAEADGKFMAYLDNFRHPKMMLT